MTTIQVRRGTAAQWASADPILASGEPGFDSTNNIHKVGDGASVWSSLPTANSNTYAPLNYRYRFTSTVLPKWTKALATVRNAAGDAKILCVGDSTVLGVGSTAGGTNPTAAAWPTRLVSLLNSAGVTAARGLASQGNATDNRWSATGWTGTNGFGFGNRIWFDSGSSHTLSYSDSLTAADTVDVYYLKNTGNGTITTTFGSGTPVAQSTNATAGIGKVTATAAAATAGQTVAMVSTSAFVGVVGVETYLSTTNKVRVGNVGVSGSTSTLWTSNATATGPANAISTYAPDLTVICLGINDATTSVAQATYAANIQTLITAAAVSGDVILMTPPPSSGATYVANEPLYNSTLLGHTECAVLDVYNRFGGVWSYWNGLGYAFDSQHPNNLGYWDIAQHLAAGLLTV